jgi:DNA helicase-2/ATP-dependent DNA helicase PcrA
MTVHQGKGMEWPVVFIPCLTRNRFPSKKPGGKTKWHVIPRQAVRHADGYDGSVPDERRLFYVALTRSKRYLFCSWAPVRDNTLYRQPSIFVAELASSDGVLTREPRRPVPERLPARPHRAVANVAFSFSELKYLFECQYQFKLRFMYGFNPPIHEALGYGKSLHDALAEVHKRALRGDVIGESAVPELLDRHLHVPFAYPDLRADLRASGIDALAHYIRANADLLERVEHVEQLVELNLSDGIVVNGRIDLIRRTDTREIVIIDFKSTERAQEEDVTRMQLHVYAIGYRELTGHSADLIEIYNLDRGATQREEVDANLEAATVSAISRAGASVKSNQLARLAEWTDTCAECDLVGICRRKPVSAEILPSS